MNRYMYVGGQPTRLVDPSGMTTQYDYLNSVIVDFVLVMIIFGTSKLIFPKAPGHNYSGDGANDIKFFAGLASRDAGKVKDTIAKWFFWRNIFKENYGNPTQEEFIISALIFVMMSQSLRPKPKGPINSVSQQHDDSISSDLAPFKGRKDAQLHARGSAEFVRDSYKTLGQLNKWQAGDAAAFIVGVPGYTFYAGLRGVEYNIANLRFDNFHKNGIDVLGQSIVMANSWNPIGWVGATFIGRSPLKKLHKPGQWRL